ncbi:integrator complex subunit 2-like [Gigantopelta aegis]|uniref:integrator complex subunit 2-like n=1 Tax=Gigantopelta aegis TaxID=1735272 RepID=UPI001B88E5AF|nr:integrator complex subunit 2-like [Gigantopelta aegis]
MSKNYVPVTSRIFLAMKNVDIDTLSRCSETDLRPVLPSLVRMALCSPLDSSEEWTQGRKDILKILSGLDIVNSIVALLSIDFHALEQDVKKEQQLRAKIGGNQTESVLISQLQHGLCLEFERSDAPRRIRLLLSELMFIMTELQVKDQQKPVLFQKQSELFESEVYLEEVCDVLCIAQAELPNLLPMTDLAEALLCVKNGAGLICQLVANCPESFTEVCRSLVSHGERQDEESVSGRLRLDMLKALCTMNPKEALNVRQLCVKHCTMPGLAISLSLQIGESDRQMDTQEDDLVAFVSSLLLGNDQAIRMWFSQFVKVGQKKKCDSPGSLLQALRDNLLGQVALLLPKKYELMSEGNVVKASSMIKLYCALRGMATLKYSEEEMSSLLELITARPPPSKTGAHFICLGLSMLIACPYLLGSMDQEQQAIEWITWLMSTEGMFEKETANTTSFGEMLFLLALHFHHNHMHAIADLVCNTLGMKSAVKANALSRIRQIFTQELFTEQVIAAHAVKIPVTPNLNANMTGYLPLHSICQLLKSRVFSKHKVPIKDWIYKQICHISLPLHPLLPQLIETYVNSIIIKGGKMEYTNEPITEEEILDVYKDAISHGHSKKEGYSKNQNLSSQLLILYYLLLYEDTLLNSMKTIVLFKTGVKSYSENILSKIPINFLIQEALKEQQLYAGLFAPLTRLLVTHYPHLCLVEDWLEESLTTKTSVGTDSSCRACTPSAFQSALGKLESCPTAVIQHLKYLLGLTSVDLMPYSEILINSLPSMLQEGTPRRVLDLAQSVWFKVHAVTPRSIRLWTVNALRPRLNTVFMSPPFTEQDLMIDPLIVLGCDERVFRCPPILEVNLRVLAAYTQACRVYLTNHLQTHPITDNNTLAEQERQELKIALIAAQESAIIQILLEICLPNNDSEKDSSQLSNRREVECLIYSYIHQVFIADPNLAKLVHFQGYPRELIKSVVQSVPSMHICLDFIAELLGQPQSEKQIFAIQLTSELCLKYSLPKSLSVAKLGINVMFTLLTVLDSEERIKFFLQTVPCLLNFCKAFPPLCEDVTTLLTQVGRICVSQLAATTNMSFFDFAQECDVDGGSGDYLLTKKRKTVLPRDTVTLYHKLYTMVQRTFSQVTQKALMASSVY